MAHEILTDSKIYLAHYNLSGDVCAINEELNQENPEHTNFSSGSFRNYLPGLRHFTFSLEGYADYAEDGQDDVINDNWGVSGIPLLISPPGGASGETARFGKIVQGEYTPGGTVGDALKFSLTGELESYEWVRGTVVSPASTSRTGTFNGSAFQLGAVGATQKLYAAIFVTAFNATSITLKIQSDDNSGFTSATDRITFTAVTNLATRAQFATPVAGAITDDYWRIVASAFTGTSASIAAVIGIQ